MRRWWPLLLVLAAQFALLAALPVGNVASRLLGVEVTLRTRPSDPFDILSGHHVELRYEVERPGSEKVPEGLREGERVFVVIRRDTPAWTFDTVAHAPVTGDPDRVSIRTVWRNRRLTLDGPGRIFLPETRREAVVEAMRESGGSALVDLKVRGNGSAAVLRLRAGAEVVGD